ncbi:MAG: hypothetical protein RLZZ40_747 [Actinomycetota bacterium]
MNEKDLIELWNRARTHLVIAQFAPTFLLITTVGLVPEIVNAGVAVAGATWGILLASGILGALVEFSAAEEAQAIARDIRALSSNSAVSQRIVAIAPWLNVAKYVTPTIFVGIFVALSVALATTH